MESNTPIKLGLCLLPLALGMLAYCTAKAQPSTTPIDFSTLDYSKFSPTEIEATERHRDELKKEVHAALQDQATINTAHGATLEDAQKAVEATKSAFVSYQSATEAQIKKGNDAIVALDHVLKKLHLAKWILTALWVVFVGYLVMQLPLAFKQYELIGGAAAITLGTTFIWLWI